MMSTLLKLGLSGYDVKPRFGAFQCEYLLQNPLFFEEKILVALDTHAKKINPPSIILRGGGCTIRPAGLLPNTYYTFIVDIILYIYKDNCSSSVELYKNSVI